MFKVSKDELYHMIIWYAKLSQCANILYYMDDRENNMIHALLAALCYGIGAYLQMRDHYPSFTRLSAGGIAMWNL